MRTIGNILLFGGDLARTIGNTLLFGGDLMRAISSLLFDGDLVLHYWQHIAIWW